ncbi:MAG: ankyrin repeat domain-containing protein, partial [Geminicoccaceae bacterium]
QWTILVSVAQTPPSKNDVESYRGLHRAAHEGNGTALIAAAHLGHHEVVKRLIEGGTPLDIVNNLNWTALIEAVVLGDGGSDHVETLRALVEAGADQTITDREGVSPLEHAKARGYDEMVGILEAAN